MRKKGATAQEVLGMDLTYEIFKSDIPEKGRYGPHFKDPGAIQLHLEKICRAWKKYLQSHVKRTESASLFKEAELPWLNTERAIVSTLAASIARAFPNSLVMEESRVVKPGRAINSAAIKAKDWGRCDLWASIQDKPDFNFYLEAKRSSHYWNTGNLEDFLLGWYGISKMFRDYLKGHPETLTRRSPYQKRRRHPHYVIGMLVTPLENTENDLAEISGILKEVFEKPHPLEVRRATAEAKAEWKRRHMARYPTVAMTVLDSAGRNPGFVASFTVLGASRELITKEGK